MGLVFCMLKFADGTRSAKAVPSSVSAVAVNAWSPSSTPPSPPLSSPSPSAPFDWMGSPRLRGAQGLSGGSAHAVSSGGRGKRVGGLDAGYPAKALGVARSDLEHCADLQATLRPEKSTSGVLSLPSIGSVFYTSAVPSMRAAQVLVFDQPITVLLPTTSNCSRLT
jgi:hypothetical protein